jgi:Ni/Co efflux regulator RcnB
MTIRKLLLPTLIAAALAAPTAFAQQAPQAAEKAADAKATEARKADAAKADAAKADARKHQQDAKANKPEKRASAEEQPDEPEEDGRR